jgi:hypothetical protein
MDTTNSNTFVEFKRVIAGSQQTKVAPRVGLHSKALFWGGHLTLGPTGPTPPNGGISFENWAGASKQKLLLAVGLQSKIFFLRVH